MELNRRKKFKYSFKYIVIGNVGYFKSNYLTFIAVGKSCLTLCFTKNDFKLVHDPTVGIEFGVKIIQVEDVLIKL